MGRIPKRVMIISFDAVGRADLDFLKTLPNFSSFFKGAALCSHVNSVYPSITYPAHTSIITGRMPKNHGVINNTKLQPGRERADWVYQRKYINSTTLYDEAKKKGMKTAALLWPVVGRSRIDWAVPEIMVTRKGQSQVLTNAVNGPLLYQLSLNRMFGHLRDGVRQPALDNFIQACALYTMETYRPDFFLLHLSDVDTNRHIYGVHHEKVTQALARQDERLGEIMQKLAQTGNMEDTCVILLGDHYQKDVEKIAYPNFFLKQEGLLTVRDGKIKGWRAIAKNCDGSCYIYINRRFLKDAALQRKVRGILERLAGREDYGIGQIFDAKEAAALGADPDCFLMVEARDGWAFLDEWEQECKTVREEKRHFIRATHGYLPRGEAYQTFFAAKGCGIRETLVEREIALWDEGVTIAALMGLDLGDADGKVIGEML